MFTHFWCGFCCREVGKGGLHQAPLPKLCPVGRTLQVTYASEKDVLQRVTSNQAAQGRLLGSQEWLCSGPTPSLCQWSAGWPGRPRNFKALRRFPWEPGLSPRVTAPRREGLPGRGDAAPGRSRAEDWAGFRVGTDDSNARARARAPPHRALAVTEGKHRRVSHEAERGRVSRKHTSLCRHPKSGTPRPAMHLGQRPTSQQDKQNTPDTPSCQPTWAPPTWRTLGTQAFATCPPSPSTILGGIPPPQIGHKFSSSTVTRTQQGHLTAGDAVWGEPTASEYLRPEDRPAGQCDRENTPFKDQLPLLTHGSGAGEHCVTLKRQA